MQIGGGCLVVMRPFATEGEHNFPSLPFPRTFTTSHRIPSHPTVTIHNPFGATPSTAPTAVLVASEVQ